MLLAVLVAAVLLAGCGSSPRVVAAASGGGPPASAQALERLVVPEVASGLPRLPDDGVSPPAGQKGLDDVARYAADPAHERQVLQEYGYRFGWERFWGSGPGPMTSVFVYQFRDWLGAAAYARDIAGNDAERYRGTLQQHPADLPGDCWALRVDTPDRAAGLSGPTSLAWCGHGVFGVSVTAVAASPSAAAAEVRAVLGAQLGRLPLG